MVVLFLFLIGFAGIGAYYLLRSHAATPYSVTELGGYGCNETQKLTLNSQGRCVRALQYGLNNWSASKNAQLASLSADGIYNEKTKAAVEKFQSSNGLPVNGTVDENTWNAFLSDCSVFKVCGSVDAQ